MKYFDVPIVSKLMNNTSFRNGTLFTVFSFFSSGINFILLIVIARYINPEGYGYINLFNTVITLLGFLICLNTSGIISVNFFTKNRDDFKKTFKAVSNITLYCSLFFILSLIVFKSFCCSYIGLPFIVLVCTIIVSFSNVYIQNLLNVWRIEEKILKYGLYSVIFALLNFITTFVFVVVLKMNWKGQVWALSLTSSLFLLVSVVILLRKDLLLNIKVTRENYKDCLSFGIPLIPHNISVWLRQGLDRIFINNFLSTDKVGLFGLSLNFSNIIIIIASAFNNSISVEIFKNLSSGKNVRAKLRKQTAYIIVLFWAISLFVGLVAYFLVPIIFPKYEGCKSYIFPQCLSAFLQCIYLQFVNYLFYYKRTRKLMYITFFTSCIHVVLSCAFTRYSVYCTLWIGVLSQLIITLLVFLYSRKVYKII